MRVIAALVLCCACAAPVRAADERPIETLPGDVVNAATVWTEPIKAIHARGFDPISGLWVGLIEGTVASAQRALGLIQGRASSNPARDGGKLFRYSF